jgi:hypothetical protein
MKMKKAISLIVSLFIVCGLFMNGVAFAAEEPILKGKTNQQTYPLTDEKITLTMWYPVGSSMAELADFNDSEFWQWYEELTNVHIDFIVPATGTESTAFPLLFAMDKLPDMVYWYTNSYNYRNGESASIDDGYFLDTMENLEYTPNYVSWMNHNPDYMRQSMTDDGKMMGMFTFYDPINSVANQGDWGMSIRKDFLDKVNMAVPTTYDELYDVLVAFRDQLGIEGAFYIPKKGTDTSGFLTAAFDVGPAFYQVDGTVKYGPLEPGYKEYMDLMRKWYAEKLIDQDFVARSSGGNECIQDNDVLLNDKIGVCISWATRLADTYVTRGAPNPDYFLIGMPVMKKTPDQVTHFRAPDQLLDMATTAVTTDCAYPEIAMRWIDGLYAEDVFLNSNYGLTEGKSYVLDAEGNRHLNYDFRYNNPDGLSSGTVLVKYWAKNPPLRTESSHHDQMDETKEAAFGIWNTDTALCDWMLPERMTRTTAEGTEFASLDTDIKTTVEEFTVKYIMGQKTESDYATFIETLKKLGIERCIEIQQAALERYNAR